MLTSLAFIFLAGLAMAAVCERIGLPRIIGMLFTGIVLGPYVLGITRVEAAVMGAVLGAISPAVVIPRMVQLMENGYGTQKSIPQMIMAGASCDDIFVIVLFTTFVRMAQGGSAKASDFVQIPISIVFGVVLGAAAGYVLARVFEIRLPQSNWL